jgi:putative transcriptional regulator
MGVSYKRLWKLLIDRDMTKTAQIATSTVSRMSRNGYVSLEVLEKICNTLNCQITDIMEFTSQEVDVQNTDGTEEDK